MMMDVFGFVLISFLSLQIFQVEGGDEPSEPTIYLETKKGKISETLGITIIFGDNPGVCLQVQYVQPLCRQVLVDREGVQLDPGLQFIPRNNKNSRNLDLTFDCSETTVFDNPINVTAAMFSSTPNECEGQTSQDHLLSEKAALIYDDRVSIEWLPHPENCYVNQSCSFSAKIGRVSHSLKDPLDLTANVTQTPQESPTIISLVKSETDDLMNFNHTFHQVGTFTAVLSVSDVLRRNVYWKKQSLKINVKTHNIQNEVEELQNEVEYLQGQVKHLETLVLNLQELQCQLQECGKYSRCIDGRCECIQPRVYNGSKCTDFVGCKNSPEACGGGRYGHCHEPTTLDRSYSCSCFNKNVLGDDCEKCSRESFCSNHGNCTVDEDGLPTCKCDTSFNGLNCEKCTKDCGQGHCVVDDETNLPICECDTNFSVESDCNKCKKGRKGQVCDELDCTVNDMTEICNGGACNEGDTSCDCTHTNYTGLFCQFKKCDGANAADVNYCKDSRGTCVYNPGSGAKVCYCDDGHLVASNETCNSTATPSPTPSPTPPTTPPPTPSPTPPADPCSSEPCKHGECSPNEDGGYMCECPSGFTGENCDEGEETESETTPEIVLNQTDNNSQLLYGGLAVFIAVLVVSVAAYIAYHNREKILELFGGKKESVVEMAMRSRTKKKGYKKLPTSIHDTLTHED